MAPEIAEEDRDYVDAALKKLEAAKPWTPETWGQATKELKAETGRKGRALFMPLRKGPDGPRQRPGHGGAAAAFEAIRKFERKRVQSASGFPTLRI